MSDLPDTDELTDKLHEFKKACLISESIARLSNEDLWKQFKNHFKLNSLDELGINCFEMVEAYSNALKGKTKRAMEKALESKSIKELKLIKSEIDVNHITCGQLRFLIKSLEKEMRGLLNGIGNKINEMGKKAEHTFYHPKPEKIIEDVKCPYCERINRQFEYGKTCQYCCEQISNPWETHTICPGEKEIEDEFGKKSKTKCERIISRRDIFSDKEAFNYDSETNEITCPDCGKSFDWKQYCSEPEKRMLKVCDNCDMPYSPDKRNWKRQRICPICKAKGVDSFYLDHPDYQKKKKK